MNDVRYVYYTERIQNMLVRPEILRLMKDGKVFDDDSKESALERAKRLRANMKGTRTLGPQQLA
jgi:ribosomal protein L19E